MEGIPEFFRIKIEIPLRKGSDGGKNGKEKIMVKVAHYLWCHSTAAAIIHANCWYQHTSRLVQNTKRHDEKTVVHLS